MKIVLPNIFKPKYETELVRIGKNNDGGYIIPIKSLNHTKKLYSFGLSDDFSFEEDFYKKTNAEVSCYDSSVNFKFFLKPFLFGHFNNLFKYIGYSKFFNGKDKQHIKKNIVPLGTYVHNKLDNKNIIEDISSLLKEDDTENLFFKIDIEGSEYRILNQLIEHSSLMTGLAIEFHDFDLHIDKIKKFIEIFELQIVHIHVNNWGYINSDFLPRALEITFSPSKFNTEIKEEKKYPIELDQPNNPQYEDLPIEFI